MAEIRHIDLYEFLVESELQHYYSSIKDELKITNASHLKYATDEDLRQVGFSKPEIRRLRKFYEKYYPHGYLSKIKRLLQPPIRRDDNQMNSSVNSTEATKVITLPSKTPTQKHIIPADLISVNKQLGAGEFGVVQQGVWTNGTERIQVAIKCLCRERMQSNPIEFLKEAAIMHAIEHENIVRLYGVVLDTNSLMLVTELAHLRSLLECLKDPGLRVNFLTVPTLCEFAMQICNGMMYLENKRLIHRDLAARNILVFSKNKVKISDFGLSRALGVGKDYYKTNFNVNLKLPIAWCAPECITFLRFTNASDVWAYGVCLWEMFSYGFQPWAALTGLQILEAIDDPNFQRLEQPECCPKDYYNLMLRCWQHESTKRPKFSEIYSLLPDMKPEQLKTVINNCEPKKDHLLYLQGEIITVLDKNSNSPFWKGVLNSGKTGLFNPSNTVAYLEGLPSSTNRDGFFRTSERLSKKKLRSEMISMPQNDLKHTLHIGLDGAYFGDVSLLGSSQQTNPLPKQIVTPYKPSEDIEQTPLLLPPTPTSPDSIQTASTYFPEENQTISQTNPSFINSNQNTPQNHNFHHTFDFPPKQTQAFSSSNPFASEAFNSQNSSSNKKIEINENVAFTNLENDSLVQNFKSNNNINWPLSASEGGGIETQHEYHEISDDEMIVDKFDYGPSLLDEINSMFGCINMANDEISLAKLQGNLNSPKTGEVVDLHLKTNRKLNGSDNNGNKAKKKTCGTVKPISVKDEKILNQAIEIANEISAKSMTDLVSDTSQTMRSPKRKFSFRLPHLTHNTIGKDLTLPSYSINGSNGTYNSQLKERKKFSEELQSISDLQSTITEEGREAYNSLIEKKSKMAFDTDLFNIATTKTLPRNVFKLDDVPKNELKKNRKALVTPISLNQNDNRPMTLPNRNSSKFSKIYDSAKEDSIQKVNCISKSQQSKYTNEKQMNGSKINDVPNNENSNPIPLPPRDRTKVILTNAKRHIRKHPLIIPASGLQRTLNKVTQESPETEYPKHDIDGFDLKSKYNRLTLINNYNSQKDNKQSDNTNKINLKLNEAIREWNSVQTVPPIKPPRNNNSNNNHKNIYANLDNLQVNLKANNTDSASLNFESALEQSFDQDDILSSPDVTDSFCPFLIQKEESKKINFNSSKISGLYVNEDELRNLDFDQSNNIQDNMVHGKTHTAPVNNGINKNDVPSNQNEEEDRSTYAKNAMESKDEVDSYIDRNELYLSKDRNFNNSVSCEDLLEFANRKPKGCERGTDSDEVRIMLKVLGKEVSPHKCINALEITEWDVHKAIKIIKLQNITNMKALNEVQKILQEHDWDLQTAIFELNIINGD